MSYPSSGWSTSGYLSLSDRSTITQRREHEAKERYKGIPRKKPNGLYNSGNRCYFNSVLQSLSHTPAFYQKLLEATDKEQLGELGQSFIPVAFDLMDGYQQPVDPQDVTNCFTTKVPRFKNSEQHDSHECLRHFLEEIRKEERERKGSGPGNSQLTVVDKIFGGHLVTVYICKECNKYYHLFEPCLDISLPVFFESKNQKDENQMRGQIYGKNLDQKRAESMNDDGYIFLSHDSLKPQISGCERNCDSVKVSEIKFKTATDMTKKQKHCVDRNKEGYKEAIQTLMGLLSPIPNDPNPKSYAGECSRSRCSSSISLSDCFKHFSRVEKIKKEYLCEDCLREAMAREEASEDNLKLTSATKQTLIFNPPAILTIHFKRFELLPGRSRKRSDMVEYPEYLDIAPYCSSQCLRNDPPRNNIWYSLYAVVVHSGSLEFGHYKAYVKMRGLEENAMSLSRFLQHEYFNHNITSDELIRMMNMAKQELREHSKQPEREEDSKWFLMNDSSVFEVYVEEALNQEAYFLFYERVDSTEKQPQ